MANDRLLGRDFGRYRVEAVIGRGGMGVVYRARDRKLDRVVALKVLSDERATDPSFRERFLRESRLLASIDHPNIVPVYEADEADNDLFIAMRFVQGPELRRIIERDGPLAPSRAATIIAQVADALDAAHAMGLVHRDIKPANILVVSGPSADHAYLTDFGLTKLAGGSTGLTQAGQFVGTPGYVAPEQIQGKGVDHRADIYALGCVLYDCLTGVVPYPRDSTMASLWAHVHEPPPKISEQRPSLPAALDAVIAKALAKDPKDRYQTAGGLAVAARKAIPTTEPSLPTVVMEAVPEEPQTTPATELAVPTTAAALATAVAGGSDEATVLASAATHLDSTPVTEVGSSGVPPTVRRGRRFGAGGFRPRSVPAIGIAIVVIVALAASAVGFGTGAIDLTGARNQLPTATSQVNAATSKPAIITTTPSIEPSVAASLELPPTPTPKPTTKPRVNNGTSLTTSRNVTVSVSRQPTDPSGVAAMAISDKSTRSSAKVYSCCASRSFTLSRTRAGVSTIYVWFRDRGGYWSAAATDTIKFDNKPTATSAYYNMTYAAWGDKYCRTYVPFTIVGNLATDKDGNATLTLVKATNLAGTVTFTINSDGKSIRFYMNPTATVVREAFRYTVRDNYGQTATNTVTWDRGPCS